MVLIHRSQGTVAILKRLKLLRDEVNGREEKNKDADIQEAETPKGAVADTQLTNLSKERTYG